MQTQIQIQAKKILLVPSFIVVYVIQVRVKTEPNERIIIKLIQTKGIAHWSNMILLIGFATNEERLQRKKNYSKSTHTTVLELVNLHMLSFTHFPHNSANDTINQSKNKTVNEKLQTHST